MGNEQAMPIQNLPPGVVQGSKPELSPRGNSPYKFQPTHEILIAVRGQRSSGKTTLVNRILAKPFNESYVATPFLQASEVPFSADFTNGEVINLKVWDVVEKALIPVDDTSKSDYPDASSIDTLKRADGLVILIDPRHKDTITLANKIIGEASIDLPIMVFSNFQDENVDPVIPELLQSKIGRFGFIPGSLKTGQGLKELHSWISVPYIYSNKKHLEALLKLTSEDLIEKLQQVNEKVVDFLTKETALISMPKVPPPPPKQEVQQQPSPKPKPVEEEPEPLAEIIAMDKNARKQEVKQQEQKPEEKEPRRKARRIIHVKRRDSSDKDLTKSTESVGEETKPSSPKTVPEHPKPKPKPIPQKDENDDFFGDDDGNDDALKLPSDHDDEDIKPNPLVQAVPQKKKAPAPIQPPVQVQQPKKEEKPKVDDENDDFFGDDDGNNNDDDMKLPSDHSDKEEVKPNPLVQAVPQKKTQKQVIPEKQENEKIIEEPKPEIKVEKQPTPVNIPVVNQKPADNDDFFGDDDEDDDALKFDENAEVKLNKLPPLELQTVSSEEKFEEKQEQKVEEKIEEKIEEKVEEPKQETAPRKDLPKRKAVKLRRGHH